MVILASAKLQSLKFLVNDPSSDEAPQTKKINEALEKFQTSVELLHLELKGFSEAELFHLMPKQKRMKVQRQNILQQADFDESVANESESSDDIVDDEESDDVEQDVNFDNLEKDQVLIKATKLAKSDQNKFKSESGRQKQVTKKNFE